MISRLHNIRAQMTVELCVIFPVVIIIAVIAVNALSFFGYCSEFDRAARNAVRVYATSPEYGQTTYMSVAWIESAIEEQISANNLDCSVSSAGGSGGHVTFEARLDYRPTLFGMGLQSSVFGVSLPALSHTTSLVVDPYKPGMLF